MRALVTIAIAAGALVLTAASTTAGAVRGGAPHQLRGLVPHVPLASRLAPATRTAKAGFNCVASCSSYESTIDQYFTDVAAASGATDNVYSVATQYSSITYGSTFGGSYVDGHPLPTTPTLLSCRDGFDKYCVTDQQLQTEIAKVIARNGWPTQSQTALYFIFTPANVGVCQGVGTPNLQTNPCTTNVFCAYHSSSGNAFLYAVEPDAAAVEGGACDTGQAPAGSAADATISTISHEHNEAITDPVPLTGWYTNDANEFEIGDLCAYDFGGTPLGGAAGAQYNQVINGHNYYLQLEYSNQDGGCVPYLGGPVTAPDPTFHDGSGPLVYEDGPVMTSNTAYAIYWVPAPPANRQLPTVSGIAKVAKKLTASHGSWSNAPTFTYRWLRCSTVGTSCKGITKATGSTYTLVKADAHHRLEVRVTATNAAGHASAVSAPSGVVRS